MGSLQPEAEGSPTPEVAEATSFERAVTRRPTVSSRCVDTSLKVGFGQERYVNNAFLLTPVDHSFPLSAGMSLGLLKTPNPASCFPCVSGDEPLTGRQKVWVMVCFPA